MAVYKRERQLKNGVRVFWQVIVDLPPDPNDLGENGKPKRRQRTEAFPTERAAKKREREWLSEIDRGIIIDRSPKTVADVLLHWLETHRPTLKEKSAFEYERVIRKHLIPELGAIKAQELTRARVEKFIADKRAQGCGDRTLQVCKDRLSQALDHAVELDIVPRNVAAKVRPAKTQRQERAVWDWPQLQRFAKVAARSSYGPIWAMFMQSGMRRGEILALRWQDVDFARGVVNVRRTVGVIGSRLTEGEPKTKSSRREVPIPAGVMAALEAHHERYQDIKGNQFDGWQDHGLVFSSETGNYINPSNLRRDFLRWVKESGVPQIAIHDLRHTFATHALENGAELIDVSKHLGHARPSITSDIYAHKLYKDHSRVADKVGALFESGQEDVVRNVVRFPRRKRAL